MRITLNIHNPQQGEDDNLLTLDVSPDTTVETLRASIQAETNISPEALHVYLNSRLLADDSKTMEQLQIPDGEMLAVHVRQAQPTGGASAPAQRQQQRQPQRQPQQAASSRPDPEQIRLQILGNPAMRMQLQGQMPELAAAADDPARFAQVLQASHEREDRERRERQREIERLNHDPFNIDNQRRIEEMIRQERVMENLQNAMEHNPEVFGRVHMLYLNVEVNGHKVKALVDSGAQATIMSPQCSDACGITRLIDTRFAGVARGVGTAKIIGRVHSAQIRIGNLFLPCSFTVMEGKSVDLLLGLDMLKRYQACIDLAKGALVIQGEDIPFLGEADIPKDVEEDAKAEPTAAGPSGTEVGQQSGAVVPAQGEQSVPEATPAEAQPAAPSGGGAPTQPAQGAAPNVSQQHVEALMAMGADRAGAIQALNATDDNVDMAASILFFGGN